MGEGFAEDRVALAALRNAESLFGGVKLHYALTVWVFFATTVLLA